MHDRIRVGDLLPISAPRGNFTLAAGTGPVVLLSAGIGATPVLSMLHSLRANTNSDREIWWLYGARNRNQHPFASEVRALVEGLPDAHTLIAYSDPGEGDRPGLDYDIKGHLTISALDRWRVPQHGEFYLCGPPSFMTELTAALVSWGVSPFTIHSETFGAGAAITPGIANTVARPVQPPSGLPGTGLLVSFARTGLSVPWNPRFQSLLEFAEACDVPVRWSCRTGVCHMCESGLIDGRVRYVPEPLDRPAKGNALICCSTPLTGIELDL
jgi:ferredoxin-NADP reductase